MSIFLYIRKGLNKFLDKLYFEGYGRLIWGCHFFAKPKKWISHKSYYPEHSSKSTTKIFGEQLWQWLRYGKPNEFYFSYGFDVKSKGEMKEYFHYNPFMKLRDKYNQSDNPIHSSIPILQNKFYFGMFCEYLGVKSANTIGLLYGENDGHIYLNHSKELITLKDFCDTHAGEFFVKPLDGECGKGIFIMNINDGKVKIDNQEILVEDLLNLSRGATFLIQHRVKQHIEMSRLHPQSLNTIRLVTVKNVNTGQINVFPSILRIGTGGSIVDNTSQGGVAVGIDFELRKLKKFGFMKPQFGGRVSEHPDSQIKFNEFSIPYLKEAVEHAKFLHSHLPDLHSIGWDIAIGEDGPIFIEGNDNWEINGPQICNGGLKDLYGELLVGKQ